MYDRATWKRKRRRSSKRRWLDRLSDDITEKGLSGRKCMTVLHGREREEGLVREDGWTD